MKSPFEDCPRYDHCSANICPLDPDQHLRDRVEGDDVCDLPKKRRMAIAAKYPSLLPARGLRSREVAAMARWEALTPEEQQTRRQVASERLANMRAKAG